MSTVNLYDVLNISQDCTIKEIKNAYSELAKVYHPDKPEGDAEMFELIMHAYNKLKNPTSRKEYDEIYTLSKQSESSHFDLKSKSKNYFSSQQTDVSKKKKTKEEQLLDFNKANEELDRKRGYKREKSVEDKLFEKDTKSLLKDLQMIREQDDIENIHEQLFDDGRFDINKFNAAFDVIHKEHNEMVTYSGHPDAWNSTEINFGASFGSIENYGDPFIEDDQIKSTIYSSIKIDGGQNEKKNKLSKEEINKITSAEYTKNHNFKDKDYNKSLEEKLQERELQTKKLEDRELNEFDTDPSCGGYGIFDAAGLKNFSSIDWDDTEDINKKYKKLLEMRKVINE